MFNRRNVMAAVLVLATALLVFAVYVSFVRQAGATVLPKVKVCQNGHTIEVAAVAVPALLQAGATLGECPEVVIVDVCSNLEGNQATVPEGYTKSDGICTPIVVEEPTDFCPTLPGVQAEDADCPQGEEEEPPIVTPPTNHGDKNCHVDNVDNFTARQGTPGDGIIEVDWSMIDGAKHVKIQYSTDSFRHAQSIVTDDDGHHRLINLENTEYSVRMWGSGKHCRGKFTKAAVLTP